MKARQPTTRYVEVAIASAGLLLLSIAGWDLLKFTAFQRHPDWFGASSLPTLQWTDVRRLSSARTGEPGPALRIIGKLEIARLSMSVLVVDGDSDEDLSVAAGHVPGTALPGEHGNSVIAGHRDMAFQLLRYIRIGDRVRVESGRTYEYVVESVRIVEPGDTAVLQNGGAATLTMLTCYPFRYIGDAPKRYAVRARLI